jgi:hypothetical protein
VLSIVAPHFLSPASHPMPDHQQAGRTLPQAAERAGARDGTNKSGAVEQGGFRAEERDGQLGQAWARMRLAGTGSSGPVDRT